ncbi:Pentatricopeptide repeat-containing protein At3g49740 [Linum perenne]
MRKFLHHRVITTLTEPAKTQLVQLNKRLARLVRSSQFQHALHLFDEIHSSSSSHHHLKPDEYTLSTALTACANLRNVAFGTELHAHAVKCGLKSHLHVSNTLLLVYARARDAASMKCVFGEIQYPDSFSFTTVLSECAKSGELEYAFQVFDEMPVRDVSAWNAVITGCVESGNEGIGFVVFRDMYRLGVSPDNYSFGSVLSGCCLERAEFGRQVHSLVIRTGSLAVTSIVNALITMYFSYEEVGNAVLVFEEVGDEVHNHISYNVMIGGLQSAGIVDEAIIMFKKMLAFCLSPSELSFVSLVSSCSRPTVGCQVHSQVIKRGFEAFTAVNNSMITMYANFEDMVSAYTIFERQREKDHVSWNAIISGYSQWNCGRSAISSYIEMQKAELRPDEFTFGSLLASSDSLRTLEMVHSAVFKAGLVSSIQLSNSLISAYCKHGNVKEGHKVFLNMLSRSLVTWNTIMSGFLLNGLHIQGLEYFSQLLKSGFRPNEHTLTIALSICASISAVEQVKQVHAHILRFKSCPRGSLGNSLITTYSKCGLLNWSSGVFNTMSEKDVVSWNALMSAYSQHGKGKEALQCLKTMSDSFEVSPDQATFSAVLSACSHAGLVDDGARVFNSMVDSCWSVGRSC